MTRAKKIFYCKLCEDIDPINFYLYYKTMCKKCYTEQKIIPNNQNDMNSQNSKSNTVRKNNTENIVKNITENIVPNPEDCSGLTSNKIFF